VREIESGLQARPRLRSFHQLRTSAARDRVKMIARTLYEGLRSRAIRYDLEPRSYGADWQLVRFHHDVLEKQRGTCIDLAVLFAALLESVHLNPVMFLVSMPPGPQVPLEREWHALVGCWKNGHIFPHAVLGAGELRSALKDLVVLDTGGVVADTDKTQSFDESLRSGRETLEWALARKDGYRLEYAVDVVAARYEGIDPMPFGGGPGYSYSAWRALARAAEEAVIQGSRNLTSRHLLLGLLSLGEDGVMVQVLNAIKEGLSKTVEGKARSSVPRGAAASSVPQWTTNLRNATNRARDLALRRGDMSASELDFVRALLEEDTQVRTVLRRVGIEAEECLAKLPEAKAEGPEVISSSVLSEGV